MPFTVAIVGRPNVGKSTLFNRLVGKRLALVDDQPGVTRDLREGTARLGDLRFTVLDTAGLEDAAEDSLQGRMRRLTEHAIGLADVCLFVIDARAGVTPQDEALATMLRKREAKVILAANKMEGAAADGGFYEAFSLGLGEPLAISAEHGEGMGALYEALAPLADAFAEAQAEAETAVAEAAPEIGVDLTEEEQNAGGPAKAATDRPLQIAVIGRPNAGKSTLVNRILGEDILLTGPEAGVTRDAIAHTVEWGGRPVRIFDTAGMRRKAKVQEKLEKLSVSDGIRAVKFAEVVIVLIDAEAPFEQQDLRLADLAAREGRAVAIGVNKWDRIADKQAHLAALKEQFERLLPQLRGAPMIAVSALNGKGLDRLREAVFSLYDVWNARIATGRLNRWLTETVQRHAPPAPGGRRIRLRYMTQVKTRPPTFVAFVSRPEDLPDSYVRFLINGLRDDFKLPGAPIRLWLRKGENPYEGKKRR